MNIEIASCAGACYGVQRALDVAHKAAAEDTRVETLGSLIHNPQVVAELSASGVSAVASPEDITAPRVIIRSHGVTPEVIDAINERGAEIIDATCPHVLRAQKAARALALQGLCVLVVGEESHPEVEGLRAWARSAGGDVIVAAQVEDLPASLPCQVGIVVQTTQRREKLDAIVEELTRRGIETTIRDTICQATSARQESAADLAKRVDVMVVIGGHNSSNTTRLFEICQALCSCAIHIETPDELDASLFKGVNHVGITAGASTPEAQIQTVIAALERIAKDQKFTQSESDTHE